MTLAILCSGQGVQHRAMFALTGEAPEAADVFAAATLALGADPRVFVKEADDSALYANMAGQILCVTQALAAFAALRIETPKRLLIAGYSVGELAAWGCAALFSRVAVIELATQRAAAMTAASGPNDGLAAVRGLGRGVIDTLCARLACALAIVNPGESFIVGGERAQLHALCQEAMWHGAESARPLKVNVAAHTPRLGAASVAFRNALAAQKTGARLRGARLFAGIDAGPVLEIGEGLDKLAAQISKTIDWAGCLEACVEAGAGAFLELGPGRGLAAMASVASPATGSRSLDDFRSIEGARAWLAAQDG